VWTLDWRARAASDEWTTGATGFLVTDCPALQMVKPFNAFDDDAEQYKKSNMIFEDEVSSRATRKSLFLSVLSSLHIYTRFFPQKGDLRTAPLPNVANVDVSYTLPYDILNTAAKRVWHLKLPMHVEIVVMGTPSEGPLTYSVDFICPTIHTRVNI
jgi:hypothetical protein